MIFLLVFAQVFLYIIASLQTFCRPTGRMACIESVCLDFTLEFVNFFNFDGRKTRQKELSFCCSGRYLIEKTGHKKKLANVNIVYLVCYG